MSVLYHLHPTLYVLHLARWLGNETLALFWSGKFSKLHKIYLTSLLADGPTELATRDTLIEQSLQVFYCNSC